MGLSVLCKIRDLTIEEAAIAFQVRLIFRLLNCRLILDRDRFQLDSNRRPYLDLDDTFQGM